MIAMSSFCLVGSGTRVDGVAGVSFGDGGMCLCEWLC
jgi:hypothetical protein